MSGKHIGDKRGKDGEIRQEKKGRTFNAGMSDEQEVEWIIMFSLQHTIFLRETMSYLAYFCFQESREFLRRVLPVEEKWYHHHEDDHPLS